MALRQSASLGLRLLQQQQQLPGSGAKLLSASLSSQSASQGAAAGAAQGGKVAAEQQATQARPFSFDGAAALAAKQAHLVGAGGFIQSSSSSSSSSRAFGSFASQGAAASSTAAATAQQAASSSERPGVLRRAAKALAVVLGACALATGTASADAPEPWQWLFQDMATSTGQAMVDLHHDIMFFVISISALVLYMLAQVATKFHYTKQLKPEKFTHHTTLEVIWTVIPTLIVLFIAVPSLTLIYSLDQHTDRPGLTVKVIGRQWYWSYEMHDHLTNRLVDPDRLAAIAEKVLQKE